MTALYKFWLVSLTIIALIPTGQWTYNKIPKYTTIERITTQEHCFESGNCVHNDDLAWDLTYRKVEDFYCTLQEGRVHKGTCYIKERVRKDSIVQLPAAAEIDASFIEYDAYQMFDPEPPAPLCSGLECGDMKFAPSPGIILMEE